MATNPIATGISTQKKACMASDSGNLTQEIAWLAMVKKNSTGPDPI